MRYYSLSSLNYLFNKFNLKIFYVKKIPTHGGSIRVYVTNNKKQKSIHQLIIFLSMKKNFLIINHSMNLRKKWYCLK